jgi:hypothetical protein
MNSHRFILHSRYSLLKCRQGELSFLFLAKHCRYVVMNALHSPTHLSDIRAYSNRTYNAVPSWSSGNDPRSGGVAVNWANVGGRPNDMANQYDNLKRRIDQWPNINRYITKLTLGFFANVERMNVVDRGEIQITNKRPAFPCLISRPAANAYSHHPTPHPFRARNANCQAKRHIARSLQND